MLDYRKPDRGWGGDPKRGAAFGRGGDLDPNTAATLRIRRVPLVDGGDYDPGGTYWGGGAGTLPLFCVFDDKGHVAYRRANDLDAAKRMFSRATWAVETGPVEGDLDDMLDGYIAGGLFYSTDESTPAGGEPLDDNYDETDLGDGVRKQLRVELEFYVLEHGAEIAAKCAWYRAGFDLWTELHEGCPLYIGDDGKIYA